MLVLACLAVSAFALSVSLVRSRQKIVLASRKIWELEKNISAYTAKNSEIDAEILRLSTTERLKSVIASDGLVLANNWNIVKVSREEINLYAMNRTRGTLASNTEAKNFQQQTDPATEN
jgi:cell division protein FtsL